MKTISKILSLVVLTTLLYACSDDADTTTEPENPDKTTTEESKYKTEGYVVSSYAQTGGTASYYAGYLKELPSGNINLEEFNAFVGYYPETTYKNFIYGGPLNSQNFEIARYAVDKETGKVIEAGKITTSGYMASIKILNDNVGVFTIRDEQKLYVFDPMAMTLTKTIELTNAKTFENDDKSQLNSYYSIIYRKQDNKVFLPLQTDDKKTGPYYDGVGIHLEVIDMNSESWVKTASFENATYPTTRGSENTVIDEQGNIYVTCQGQYSLDGQAGPSAPQASRPQILKIPAGSNDFDSSYSFNPIDELGFNNLIAQFLTGTVYGKNGIAYAAISAKADSPRVLELVQKLGAGTITSEEYAELRNLVIEGANSRWAKLDLNAKTATVIEDIPFTAGFGFPFSYNYGGKVYLQAYNTAQGINGYYEYDQDTGKAKSLYNVSKGGIAIQFIKLEK